MDKISYLESFFTPAENTAAGHTFCDIPIPITFDNSKICIIGIPIDITTTFGKTTSLGPEAIRISSESLEGIDRMLAAAESRRSRAFRNIEDCRASFAKTIRNASDSALQESGEPPTLQPQE